MGAQMDNRDANTMLWMCKAMFILWCVATFGGLAFLLVRVLRDAVL